MFCRISTSCQILKLLLVIISSTISADIQTTTTTSTVLNDYVNKTTEEVEDDFFEKFRFRRMNNISINDKPNNDSERTSYTIKKRSINRIIEPIDS